MEGEKEEKRKYVTKTMKISPNPSTRIEVILPTVR